MPRVLIIEDDPALRDFFVFDFESLGFETLSASDGREALRILNDEAVDAIISDIQMPGVSGLEIARSVRQTHRDPAHPVIVLITGHQEILSDEAYALGVNAFLYKPFSRQDLSQMVRMHLVPPHERWVSEQNHKDALLLPKCGDLEVQVDQWSTAAGANGVTFGQGGIFIPMNEGFPDLMTRIDFLITSPRPEEGTLQGAAAVRWVRRITNGELPPGVGLEILTLDAQGGSRLLQFLQKNPTSSYIPRA